MKDSEDKRTFKTNFILSAAMSIIVLLGIVAFAMSKNGEKPQIIEYVPANSSSQLVESAEEITSKSVESSTEYIKIWFDLNKATASELDMIPGIGEVISTRIIEYRSNNGSFRSVDELINVTGIGEKTLAKFREYLYVEGGNEINTEPQQTNPPTIETPSVLKETPQPTETPKENHTSEVEQTEIPSKEIEILHLDMNKASVEEFATLPGIDIELAKSIVELREKIQYFSHPYELLYVDGMTENKLNAILQYIYV